MATKSASIKRAVDNAIRSAQLSPREEATAALAKRLAAEIDDADDPELVAKLSARLLPVLDALGMTRNGAPAATKGGATSDAPTSALDRLRDRRDRLRSPTGPN
jgi:hypothetical protein